MGGSRLSESELVFEKLSRSHSQLVSAFSCSHKDEDEFIKRDAFANQQFRLSETFLLLECGKLISYVTLGIGSFVLSQERQFHGLRIREKPYNFPNKVPCMLICKLATDSREEGRGGASHLLSFAFQEAIRKSVLVPFPFLALHAYPEKVDFYRKRGFEVAFAPKSGAGNETVCMFMELPSDDGGHGSN